MKLQNKNIPVQILKKNARVVLKTIIRWSIVANERKEKKKMGLVVPAALLLSIKRSNAGSEVNDPLFVIYKRLCIDANILEKSNTIGLLNSIHFSVKGIENS